MQWTGQSSGTQIKIINTFIVIVGYTDIFTTTSDQLSLINSHFSGVSLTQLPKSMSENEWENKAMSERWVRQFFPILTKLYRLMLSMSRKFLHLKISFNRPIWGWQVIIGWLHRHGQHGIHKKISYYWHLSCLLCCMCMTEWIVVFVWFLYYFVPVSWC